MGQKKNGRREKRKKSDDSVNNENTPKAGRYTASPTDVPVSKILKEANFTLYSGEADDSEALSDDSDASDVMSDRDLDLSVLYGPSSSDNSVNPTSTSDMESTHSGPPSNADIMEFLKRLDCKLTKVESKMEKLDLLEAKLCTFEKEVNKMWTYIRDSEKKTEERIRKIEDKVEGAEFSAAVSSEKIGRLEKDRDALKDEVVYLQSQSMRNNLVFTNIEEGPRGETEDCEQKLRSFLQDKMNMANDLVKQISFDRVHRMGQRRDRGCRNIVAKFTLFKDRESVRKEGRTLRGTNHHVFEQFPKDVADKRRRLMPQLKEARRNNKRAWLSYDTLFIDGRPVKDKSESESRS